MDKGTGKLIYFSSMIRTATRYICWMVNLVFLCLAISFNSSLSAQELPVGWQQAMVRFAADPDFRYASWSIVVADAETGKILVDHQGSVGLPGASTQKIFTSIAALDLLGSKFRFETVLQTDGIVRNEVLDGNLIIHGEGDPSFGSSRFGSTTAPVLLESMSAAVKAAGIREIRGQLLYDSLPWEDGIPDGWIWQDIGNYYGAGAYALNWRENQFDIYLQSGNTEGSRVKILQTEPALAGITLKSSVVAGKKASGDNAYLYLPPAATSGQIKGSIPVAENRFEISGSLPDPSGQFLFELEKQLDRSSIKLTKNKIKPAAIQPLWQQQSPTLDSLNHWFLRRSINLYGEALLKKIGARSKGYGSTENGLAVLKSFWQERGIDSNAIQIIDGSGLSPQNRLTAGSLVKALLYARAQSWFPVFYEALPTYNGMRLKSGSIGGSRAFAGYHQSAAGKKYVLAVIVNNYSGTASSTVKKILGLLDHWK